MTRGAAPATRDGRRRGRGASATAAMVALVAGGLSLAPSLLSGDRPIVTGLTPARAADTGRTVAIEPGDSVCRALRSLPPGGELVLAPGDYEAGCAIRQGGRPGAPSIIRGADLTRRPRLVYPGAETNVLEVRADHVVVRGLAFAPTRRDVDAVRIHAAEDVAIEDCEFSGIQGIPIVANHTSGRGLAVRRNRIVDSRSTAIYLGCHDGAQCAIRDALVEGNYIRRTGLGGQGVGFGVQIKLNSAAIVRDNVIVAPRGPGIMVYGARDDSGGSVVEGNFVEGSTRSSGIVIGGGPVVVRNNISVANAEAGIGVEDYGGRGLLHGIEVAHNTAYGSRGGIVVRAGSVGDLVVANNAVHAATSVLPADRPGLVLAGNVDCRAGGCFRDPSVRDFSPGRAIRGRGVVREDLPAVERDFAASRRGAPPSVGAVEREARATPDAPKEARPSADSPSR